jgi:hypothetical protein
MIDSAITPEPIVATVLFERGDMSASIGSTVARGRPVSRVIALNGRRSVRTGRGLLKDEGRSLTEKAAGLSISSLPWEERRRGRRRRI